MTDREEIIKGFINKLGVRDLRGLARSRKMPEYKTMKKKDLASQLFEQHFMEQRDKDKFAPKETNEPLPNFAGRPKGLGKGVGQYARGAIVTEEEPQAPSRTIPREPALRRQKAPAPIPAESKRTSEK